MNRIPGVVIAVVKNRDDPAGEGRLQVEFPWLAQGPLSAWAPIAVFMAGGDRGAYFMPEIDDEVLVAFEHGDFDHPYVVGFLWNGEQRPPAGDINPSVRRLRTVSGHTLEFDDNGGQERVLLVTAGGHRLELKDSAPASVTLQTSGGQEIKLEDTPAAIGIRTAAGNEIRISDAPPGITFTVSSGMVNVNCMQASLTASAALNITAPLTVFSGVVQTPTLIAQAVVGSAYTPAPGNTFGL